METPPPASDPVPAPPPVSAEQPLNYRPVSLLAVGSLVAAASFLILIVIIGGVALSQSTPVYLSSWFLGLAVLGAVLAALARRRILNSEGTLAGLKIAAWGWWLSVVAGLGYAAFYGATALAVTQQADNFLRVEGPDSGFFPLLLKGDLNRAFLLTQPQSRRAGADPNDREQMNVRYDLPQGKMPKGFLSMFRGTDVFRTLLGAGETVEVKPLGVKEWTYGNKGFTVKRTYRVSTPEAEMELLVTAQSTEGDESGPGRKWFVPFPPPPTKVAVNLTPLGRMTTLYRQQARQFIRSWVDMLNQNHSFTRVQAFLMTCEPNTREDRLRVARACAETRLIAQGFTRFGVAPGAVDVATTAWPLFSRDELDGLLPGIDAFASGKAVDRTDWNALTQDAALRQKVRAQVEDSFFGRSHPGRVAIQLKGSDEIYVPFRKKDGKIQFLCEYDLPVGGSLQEPIPKFMAECVIVAEAREVGSPEEVTTLSPPERHWRLVSVEMTRLYPMPPIGPLMLKPGQEPPSPPGGTAP